MSNLPQSMSMMICVKYVNWESKTGCHSFQIKVGEHKKIQPVHTNVCGPMRTLSLNGATILSCLLMTTWWVEFIFGSKNQKLLGFLEVQNLDWKSTTKWRWSGLIMRLNTPQIDLKFFVHLLVLSISWLSPTLRNKIRWCERKNKTMLEMVRCLKDIFQYVLGRGRQHLFIVA